MRVIQEEHSREVNALHIKLNQSESDLYQLERQLQQATNQLAGSSNGNNGGGGANNGLGVNHNGASQSEGGVSRELHLDIALANDLRKIERQSGEVCATMVKVLQCATTILRYGHREIANYMVKIFGDLLNMFATSLCIR